jgi:hypothetical protein
VSPTDTPLRSNLFRAGRFLVLPTLALAFVIALAPGRVELAVRVYALILCGVALVLLIAALRRAYPPATDIRKRSGRERSARQAPATLARLEQEVALGVAGSFDLHHRLRPRLRRIAGELLVTRRGISLDADPDRARLALGDETWALVREDRPPPDDRLARGIAIPELTRVVESLENA